MRKKQSTRWALAFSAALLMAGCRGQYHIGSITPQRVEMTSAFDVHPNEAVQAVLAPYKHKVDSAMNSVIGQSAMNMTSGQPESLLSDFVADMLYDEALAFDKDIDFSVVNVGGLRASMQKGDVTVGNIFEITPFENSLAIVTLSGENLLQLLNQIADFGGQGVSKQLRMEMNRDRKVLRVSLCGKDIDPTKSYKVATLDYLAEGNDRLPAFKLASEVNKPSNQMIRDLLFLHIRKETAAGRKLGAQLDGRIKYVEE